MPPDSEFGSDGQIRPSTPTEQGTLNETGFAEQAAPVDPFEASEPASAAQRHPMENLLLTTAHAVEHLTRNGDGKQHNEAVKAAIGAVEADASKFGG